MKKYTYGTSLAVQGLRLHTSIAGDVGSNPGQGFNPCIGESHAQSRPNNKNEKNKIMCMYIHAMYIYTYMCITENNFASIKKKTEKRKHCHISSYLKLIFKENWCKQTCFIA